MSAVCACPAGHCLASPDGLAIGRLSVISDQTCKVTGRRETPTEIIVAVLASDDKPTNPKDMIGSTKLPLNLVPDTISVYATMAFAEGASKYGAYNWRVAGVRFSIYYAAMRRHQKKLWNGEWADPKTLVPHLASIIACAGIIADAKLCGKLTDDRPPTADMEGLIAEAEGVVAHVVKMNAGKNPTHYTAVESLR